MGAKLIKCAYCGKEFYGVYPQVCCSYGCRRTATNEKRMAAYYAAKPILTIVCKLCGEPFQTTKGNRKYCDECCDLYAGADPKKKKIKAESKEFEELQNIFLKCGRPEFLLLDSTLATLKQAGKTYAQGQKERTLEMIKKIDVKGFMDGLRKESK